MNYAGVVQILHRLYNLQKDSSRCVLRKLLIFMYGIEQLTTFANFGHKTDVSSVFVYFLDPNYIRMIDVFKNIDLILKSFLILNMASSNLLDCNFLIRLFIYCLIHMSICTFTKLFYKRIVSSYRVSFRLDPKISLKTSFSHFQICYLSTKMEMDLDFSAFENLHEPPIGFIPSI